MSDSETIDLRVTQIGGRCCVDDFAVIWREMSIGRIMRGDDAPHIRPQWSWSCHLRGRPQSGNDRGSGVDLDEAKAQFKAAWERIRAGLSVMPTSRKHSELRRQADKPGSAGAI